MYISQKIPNRKGALSNVEQEVFIIGIQIDWEKLADPTYESQIRILYEIKSTLGGEDISKELKNMVSPKVFTNKEIMFQRSFEEETLFQPIPNPNYVNPDDLEEGESLPISNEPYLTMGAFDFIIGELVMKRIDLLIPFLKLYILDNYEDGWFNSTI